MKKPSFYLKKAKEEEESGDLEKALEWLDQGRHHHPKDEAIALKKASILMESFEDVDQAFFLLLGIERSFHDQSLEELKKRLDPGLLLEVYLLLTDCFRVKESFHEAFSHALMAQKIAPDEEAAILALATAHFELGHYEKAKEWLRNFEDDPTPECFWLLGQILCAEGKISEADEMFLAASDDEAYHVPIRLSQSEFIKSFNQALLGLPEEIANAVHDRSVQMMDLVPVDLVINSNGRLCPKTVMSMEDGLITIFQWNIENLVAKKSKMSETIASVLLHGLREKCV